MTAPHDPDRDDRLANLEAPDAAAIATLAEAAREALPDPFRRGAAEVLIRVEEVADDATLDALGIEDLYALTGVYEGVALIERGATPETGALPATIRLFRRALLDEWAARPGVTLGALVTHVIVHELAHHFGWSDDDIARIDRWWEESA
ncbi:MAG: metallopeptidase family protein [Pseudomonadota bacterium]